MELLVKHTEKWELYDNLKETYYRKLVQEF